MVKTISKELAEHIYRGGFIHCKDIHDDTCVVNAIKKFISVFRASIKLYGPVHVIPVLIFKMK